MKLFSHNAVIKYKNAESYQISNTEYNASDLTRIEIVWLSGSIEIVAAESNDCPARALIEESGAAVLSEENKLRTLYENGVLKIKFQKSGCKRGINHAEKHLKITLSATETLSELQIHSASAAVFVSDISAQKLQIETASGNAELNNCEAKNLAIETASGAVSLKNLAGNTAKINTASGNVEICDFTFPDTDVQTASGNVALDSGDFEKSQNGARIIFNTASGKITAKDGYIPDNGAYLYGNGARRIAVETASGSITIK